MKIGVVLFNLGGPDSLAAVEPFLKNLFSDPAIVRLPGLVRRPLAALIAKRRAPVAREIYARLGGASPILAETQAQGWALEAALAARGHQARCFPAMRCWRPFTEDALAAVVGWQPEHIVLLPLYPQFSTTTTASSHDAWCAAAEGAGLTAPTSLVCCYPWDAGFIAAIGELVSAASARRRPGLSYRVLFSAHGLPKRIADRGDPYQWQVEQTVGHIVEALAIDLDWRICYQSRVGPLQWLEPATDAEIRRAGAEGKGVIVVPVAFVSEHSETLVELDMDYGRLAGESGVPDYIRVPTVRTGPAFIGGLADLVVRALDARTVTCAPGRICPAGKICAFASAA